MRFQRFIRQLEPDVLHGHGAKAGAFMRIRTASRGKIRVYTPHGGSLHYPLSTLKGNVYARIERALQRFAENWQLPVGCGFRFQDTFDNRHPLYAGDVGIGINPRLAQRVRDADLIVALGVRLGEMTTGGYTLLEVPRPRQKLVHIHAGAEELGRVYAADLMMLASVGSAAKALEALTAPPEVAWRDWTAAAAADLEANRMPLGARAATTTLRLRISEPRCTSIRTTAAAGC